MKKIITNFRLFEKKEIEKEQKFQPSSEVQKEVDRFERRWEIKLDPRFTMKEIEIISEGLEYYNTKFIKSRIDRIIRKDLGGVHGRWKNTETKKWMTLNPRIFNFKRRWKDEDTDIPYALFTVVHEIAHCVDHLEKISFSKKWQAISGWKKCDINDRIPEGYKRYIEKRPGRKLAGHKKSGWIYKEGSDFCRKYTSRNPREDFADCLAFVILGFEEKLKGEGGLKKLEIIKQLLKKID
jgi:hypothetical protein